MQINPHMYQSQIQRMHCFKTYIANNPFVLWHIALFVYHPNTHYLKTCLRYEVKLEECEKLLMVGNQTQGSWFTSSNYHTFSFSSIFSYEIFISAESRSSLSNHFLLVSLDTKSFKVLTIKPFLAGVSWHKEL